MHSQSSAVGALHPIRKISDPAPSFVAVAVDTVRNEVIAADENLLQIVVYDRLTNTPASAMRSEPKRVLGGDNTKIEFICGLYVDPQNGEIYGINNDTENTLVVYPPQVGGNIPAAREFRTPHGTFGMAIDERHHEVFLTTQHSSSVVVYRKGASGREGPIRLLQGDRTRLADPHGVAIDTTNDLIFVTNHGSTASFSKDFLKESLPSPNWPIGGPYVTGIVPGSGRFQGPSIAVYARAAGGDAAPVRTIEGPKTQLDWPSGIAVDEKRRELLVANDAADAILVFPAEAHGDVPPIRVLKGPRTGLKNPTGLFLDTKNNELWVANFGNHSLTVYSPIAQGDTPPLRTIRSSPRDIPALMMSNPGAVAYDSKRGELLVPN